MKAAADRVRQEDGKLDALVNTRAYPEHSSSRRISSPRAHQCRPSTIIHNPLVYASQRPLPDATQDLVHGRSLGFAAAVISDD